MHRRRRRPQGIKMVVAGHGAQARDKPQVWDQLRHLSQRRPSQATDRNRAGRGRQERVICRDACSR